MERPPFSKCLLLVSKCLVGYQCLKRRFWARSQLWLLVEPCSEQKGRWMLLRVGHSFQSSLGLGLMSSCARAHTGHTTQAQGEVQTPRAVSPFPTEAAEGFQQHKPAQTFKTLATQSCPKLPGPGLLKEKSTPKSSVLTRGLAIVGFLLVPLLTSPHPGLAQCVKFPRCHVRRQAGMLTFPRLSPIS